MAIHFSKQEFSNRKSNIIKSMKEQNIDALLMFRQESMYWLTGYDTFGYVFFQTLILDLKGNLILLTRAPDLRQAKNTSIIKETFASQLKMNDDNTFDVTREVDGGLETIRIKTPCVITTDLRLNEPRYASLPNIMKAKQKKIEILEIDSLGIDIKNRLELLEVTEPPERKPGIKVEDVDSLVDKLKNEAKIL